MDCARELDELKYDLESSEKRYAYLKRKFEEAEESLKHALLVLNQHEQKYGEQITTYARTTTLPTSGGALDQIGSTDLGTRTRNQDHAVEVGAGGTVTTQATTTGGPSVGVSDPTPEAKASLLVPCSAGSSFISGR